MTIFIRKQTFSCNLSFHILWSFVILVSACPCETTVTLTLHLSVHPHKFISFLFWFVHFFKTQGENISNSFGRGLKVTTTSVSSASPELIPVAGRHLVVLEDF